MAAVPKVDALELARMVNRWRPRGVSVELMAEDREGLRSQLAEHLADELKLADVDVDLLERFDGIATSPFYASTPGEDDDAGEVTS